MNNQTSEHQTILKELEEIKKLIKGPGSASLGMSSDVDLYSLIASILSRLNEIEKKLK